MIFSVIVATHQRRQVLAECLNALRVVELPSNASLEVLVVANACTDGTSELVSGVIATFPYELRLVEEPRLGLSQARNRGVQEARGDWLAFLDDDAIPDALWAVNLTRALEQGADLIGGRVDLGWTLAPRPDWLDPRLESLLSRTNPERADQAAEGYIDLIGANFALRRSLLVRTGIFDQKLGRYGKALLAGEETALMTAALKGGARVIYLPSARVTHLVLPDKVERSYFLNAAAGVGHSQVLTRTEIGAGVLARIVIGRSVLALVSLSAEIASKLISRDDLVLYYRCRRAIAWGGLRALGKRRSKAPTI
jgi:glycosyltransferase involved in cell wall biosynthesis